jgi:serine/threonine-protein kinase
MRPQGQSTTSEHAVVDVTDRLGTILSGWRLDAVLGQSPTNTVFIASDRAGRRAALRLMHGRNRGDSGLRRRVFREVSTLRRVNHPGTVAVMLADVTATGEPYAVMERLRGLDIARLMRAVGHGLAPAAALSIVARLADVLGAAHTAGVVHRNVHSATVFPCSDGSVRLLDFGLATNPDDTADQSFAALGGDVTPFAPPDPGFAEGQGVGPRADVYSAGAVLGALLLGPDLLDASDVPLADRIRQGIGHYAIDPVTKDIAEIVLLCLAERPDHRPESGTALAGMVRSRLDGLGVIDAEGEAKHVAELVSSVLGEDKESAAGSAWQSFETLRDVFERVERALYIARRFGWEHEEASTMIESVLQLLLDAVREDPEGMAWLIRPHGFEFRGRLVWEPRPPFETIPYHLFDAGFRRLRILPGVDKDECRRFLRWLVTDPDVDLPSEDDLATAYWRHEFVHVRCDLVSAVVLQDLDEYDVLDRELRELRASAVVELRASLTRRFDEGELSDDHVADTVADVVQRHSLATISASHTNTLAANLAPTLASANQRLAEVLSWVWVDAVAKDESPRVAAAFASFAADCAHEDDPLRPFRVAGRIVQLLPDPALTRPFVVPFEGLAAIRRLLEYWSPPTDGAMGGDALAELDLLRTMLGRLSPVIYESVAYAVARSTSTPFIEATEPWMKSYAAGNAAILGPLIPGARADAAQLLLGAVLASGDDTVPSALLVATEHPDDRVRLDAFAALARLSPQMARTPFGTLLFSNVPATRRAAIRIAVDAKLTPAVMPLMERARGADFDRLPYLERQEVLSAVVSLDQARGEELLVELMTAEGSLSSADRDHTRELVADLLAEHARSGAALRTLKSIAYVRFWTAKPIRERARAAIERIEKRGGGGG